MAGYWCDAHKAYFDINNARKTTSGRQDYGPQKFIKEYQDGSELKNPAIHNRTMNGDISPYVWVCKCKKFT